MNEFVIAEKKAVRSLFQQHRTEEKLGREYARFLREGDASEDTKEYRRQAMLDVVIFGFPLGRRK